MIHVCVPGINITRGSHAQRRNKTGYSCRASTLPTKIVPECPSQDMLGPGRGQDHHIFRTTNCWRMMVKLRPSACRSHGARGVTEKADVYSFGIILFELNSRWEWRATAPRMWGDATRIHRLEVAWPNALGITRPLGQVIQLTGKKSRDAT